MNAIYKAGYPQQKIKNEPLRAQNIIFNKMQTNKDNDSPEFNFNEQERLKLRNKVRPKGGNQTSVVILQRQQDSAPTRRTSQEDLYQQIQKNAETIIEAHQFNIEFEGMQSLPLKNRKELRKNIDQEVDQMELNLLNMKTQPKFQSAKVQSQNQLRLDIDYDQLRQQSLKGRRSARNRPEQTQQTNDNYVNTDDFNITGDTIYILEQK